MYELHHGDCVEVMRSLPAESVDAIVTSPPYAEQRKTSYGGVPEAEYPEWTVAWMAEARRLLKPDGSVMLNIRPHLKGGVISDYTLRTRLALREDGWAECEELIWDKKGGGGPFGSRARPRRSWESVHWFAKHGRPWSDPKAAGGMGLIGKVRSKGRDYHGRGNEQGSNGVGAFGPTRCQDIFQVSTRSNPDIKRGGITHPAMFPAEVAEWCAKLICPPGGTILDPFNGSASTGVAAIRNGWDYIGIDAVQEYIEMSEQRLLHVTQQMEQETA